MYLSRRAQQIHPPRPAKCTLFCQGSFIPGFEKPTSAPLIAPVVTITPVPHPNTLPKDSTHSNTKDKKTTHAHHTKHDKTHHQNNHNSTNNMHYQHTNRSLQNNIPHPKYTPNIQIHPLQNNIHVSKVHCGSTWEPGASRLSYYCTPPVRIPAVIGGLAVWVHNNKKNPELVSLYWSQVIF